MKNHGNDTCHGLANQAGCWQRGQAHRDFKHKIETGLYGFENPRSVAGPLKPIRRVQAGPMITEWPNIEQEIWNECARLIANAVLHYNAMRLSEMVNIFEKQKDSESLKNLERISPLAWQHVNFYGRYQFVRDLETLKFAQMAKCNT